MTVVDLRIDLKFAPLRSPVGSKPLAEDAVSRGILAVTDPNDYEVAGGLVDTYLGVILILGGVRIDQECVTQRRSFGVETTRHNLGIVVLVSVLRPRHD